ncbi:MAG: hypothetical protein LQ338_006340, partial [Usnochroma carphineum]
MAAVDGDSDSSASVQPKRATLQTNPKPYAVRSHVGSPHSNHSTSEDDSYRVVAPRGKVAARLQKQNCPNDGSSGSDNDNTGDAYARLKRKLVEPSSNGPIEQQVPASIQAPLSTDEDDVLPAVTRRKTRSIRVAPSGPQSPVASIGAPQRSSPGLFLTPQKKQRLCSQSPLMDTNQRDDAGSDMPADPQADSRFLALVARKKEERETKAKAEAEKKARRLAELQTQKQGRRKGRCETLGFSEDDSDVAGEEKLTQQA